MALNWINKHNGVDTIDAKDVNDLAAAITDNERQIAENERQIAENERQIAENEIKMSQKVDKITGKGLSANDYTTAEKNKLAGIASGAEVNIQSDWNITNSNSDAYIKNKPSVYTKDEINDKLDNIEVKDYSITEKKLENGAVTEHKIAEGAVTTMKIADGNVTS